MEETGMNKLVQKAKSLRLYMIIYVICMNLMQIFAHLHKPTIWTVIPALLTSLPFWIIYLRSGFSNIMSDVFSMAGYDVYVKEFK